MTTEHHHSDATVADVRFEDHRLVVDLADGRTIATPIGWFPRLREATDEHLANWHPSTAGTGIHWPDVDEDLSIDGLFRGSRSREELGAVRFDARSVLNASEDYHRQLVGRIVAAMKRRELPTADPA